MYKACEFIRECGVFFVLTVNGDSPAGRPFGAVMVYEKDMYIATTDGKPVYTQLKEHGKVQLLALKEGTRSWARVSGQATECEDIGIKERMMQECPILEKHYDSPHDPRFHMFRIVVSNAELYE